MGKKTDENLGSQKEAIKEWANKQTKKESFVCPNCQTFMKPLIDYDQATLVRYICLKCFAHSHEINLIYQGDTPPNH